MKRLGQFILLFLILLPVISFINTNLLINFWAKMSQDLIFSVCLSSSIFFPGLKKYYLILAAILIVLMVGSFMFKVVAISDLLGSTAIGIVTVILISYVPQLVKKGYIENI